MGIEQIKKYLYTKSNILLKTLNLKYIKYFLVAVLFFVVSCTTTSQITIQVLKPAKITFPSAINKIVVVNRSLLPKSDNYTHYFGYEGNTYKDSLYPDTALSKECIDGLIDVINSSQRFDSVFNDSLFCDVSNISEQEKSLNWKQVTEICSKNNADVLLELNSFDIFDFFEFNHLDFGFINATLVVYVKSTWKIYYPKNKIIIDKYTDIDTISWSNDAYTKDEAIKSIPNREQALFKAAYLAGQKYGFRILPHWRYVNRMYYLSNDKEKQTINKLIESNNWNAIASIWRKYINNPNKKIAAKAAYNMALACEMEDKLELALYWVRRSYSIYKAETTMNYIYILKNRIIIKDKLIKQMSGV